MKNIIFQMSIIIWPPTVCFCVENTEKLKQLNIELQGQNKFVTDAFISIKSFKMKLLLFEN